jgi:GAF domain-containing protein
MAERLAHEQAALRRVATLVARGAETSEVFAAVAREVAEVMQLPVAAVQRYDDDDETTTMLAAWGDRPHPFQPGMRWPLHPSGLPHACGEGAGRGRECNRRGTFAAAARALGFTALRTPRSSSTAVWGLVTIASADGRSPIAGIVSPGSPSCWEPPSRTPRAAPSCPRRGRIVAAADETRRRLERDLHDGIQQRLVSLGLKAQMIRR